MSVGGVIAIDTETFLIEPGKLAPELVCLQWQVQGESPHIVHRDFARPIVERILTSDAVVVGHNLAFDTAVLSAAFPDLIPAIFDKYRRDGFSDSKIREQLLMIARGQFRSYAVPLPEGGVEMIGVKYTLADCIARHFGRQLKKEGFRLFYRLFDRYPDTATWPTVAAMFQERGRDGHWPDWVTDYLDRGLLKAEDIAGLLAADPSEAVSYALADATTTLELYEDQTAVAARLGIPLDDEYRQARAAFALHLSSSWGIHTDGDAVEELAGKLEEEFAALTADLQAEGIIRADGSADTKAAMAAMVDACAEEGIPVAMTRGGKKPRADGTVSPPQVSLGAEACERFDESSVIGMYSTFQQLRKTLRNDIKMLRSGVEIPIQPRYDLADTGRSRAAKPNIQATTKEGGIRDCFRPREGYVFIQADYPSLELYTLAQWCLERLGKSELAKLLNAGLDAHIAVAAQMLRVSYEEAFARYKAGDKQVKQYRQGAKAVNYGLPGGLGDKKLVRYAKHTYGVTMTLEEAAVFRSAWMATMPEMIDFFELAARATADGVGEECHPFVMRVRGGCRYAALCNGRFQGLGADCAKEGLWRVTEACYAQPSSALYGCRPVAFIHDEIIAECVNDPDKIDGAARELGRHMAEGANVYLKDVPISVVPCAMTLWSKDAEQVLDAQGRIVPWAPKVAEAAAQAA